MPQLDCFGCWFGCCKGGVWCQRDFWAVLCAVLDAVKEVLGAPVGFLGAGFGRCQEDPEKLHGRGWFVFGDVEG